MFGPVKHKILKKIKPHKSLLSYINLIAVELVNSQKRFVLLFNSMENLWESIESKWKDIGIDRQTYFASTEYKQLESSLKSQCLKQFVSKPNFQFLYALDYSVLNWLAKELNMKYNNKIVLYSFLINDTILLSKINRHLNNELKTLKDLIAVNKDHFAFNEKVEINKGDFIPRDSKLIQVGKNVKLQLNSEDKKNIKLTKKDLNKELIMGDVLLSGKILIEITQPAFMKSKMVAILKDQTIANYQTIKNNPSVFNLDDYEVLMRWKTALKNELKSKNKNSHESPLEQAHLQKTQDELTKYFKTSQTEIKNKLANLLLRKEG